MIDSTTPTFGDLLGWLRQLGFRVETRSGGVVVCHHAETDTILLFTHRSHDQPIREDEAISVHRQLSERGFPVPAEREEHLTAMRQAATQAPD